MLQLRVRHAGCFSGDFNAAMWINAFTGCSIPPPPWERLSLDSRNWRYTICMCRNIRPLFNFDPPATDDEIRAASSQFVRKLCGFDKPSRTNEAAFCQAVDQIAEVARTMMDSLVTTATARDRAEWSERAKARSAERFARPNR